MIKLEINNIKDCKVKLDGQVNNLCEEISEGIAMAIIQMELDCNNESTKEELMEEITRLTKEKLKGKEYNPSNKMIIGEEKIKMDEGDFIGLVTNLANDNICPGDYAYCNDANEESWAKVLSKWIEV